MAEHRQIKGTSKRNTHVVLSLLPINGLSTRPWPQPASLASDVRHNH